VGCIVGCYGGVMYRFADGGWKVKLWRMVLQRCHPSTSGRREHFISSLQVPVTTHLTSNFRYHKYTSEATRIFRLT
jgi:hypothetical protein